MIKKHDRILQNLPKKQEIYKNKIEQKYKTNSEELKFQS